jgi:hypothetical protein
MSSFWTDLLFLHGYITDRALARRLTDASPPSSPNPRQPQPSPATRFWRWSARLCLGIGDGTVRTQ